MGTYSQLLKKPQAPPKQVEPFTQETKVTETDNASMLASKQDSNLASYKASLLAIPPFNEEDVAVLRQSTYNQFNVRGTENEVEWLKDTAYQLSKDVKRGRVNQGDIVRVGLRLFQKLMETNKAELIKVLEQIK